MGCRCSIVVGDGDFHRVDIISIGVDDPIVAVDVRSGDLSRTVRFVHGGSLYACAIAPVDSCRVGVEEARIGEQAQIAEGDEFSFVDRNRLVARHGECRGDIVHDDDALFRGGSPIVVGDGDLHRVDIISVGIDDAIIAVDMRTGNLA